MARIECPRCGKVNDGTTDFCIYCGTIFEEYNPEDEDFNIFSISKKSNYRMSSKSSPEDASSGNGNYRWMIIIGYLFAILGSVLGFIFAIYLITRIWPNRFFNIHWTNGSKYYLKSIQYHKHDSNVQFKCNEYEWFH